MIFCLNLWICQLTFCRHLQTSNRIILVQIRLEKVIDILSCCAQRSQTEAKGPAMTNDL